MHYSIIFLFTFIAGALSMPQQWQNPRATSRYQVPQPPASLLKTTARTARTSLSQLKPSTKTSTKPLPAASTSPVPTKAASIRQSSPSSGSRVRGTAQAYLSAGPDYQAAILYHHNAARANHNAAPLTWDSTCEQNARIAAERCDFVHYIPSGVRQGQNLYTTSSTAFNVTAGITESWYKSEFPPMLPYYGQANVPDDVFHKVGHLTQVVWKGTTGVGCVSIDCGSKMTINGQPSKLARYTVCNYSPPGNVGGRFAENVARPNSNTNLGSWTD